MRSGIRREFSDVQDLPAKAEILGEFRYISPHNRRTTLRVVTQPKFFSNSTTVKSIFLEEPKQRKLLLPILEKYATQPDARVLDSSRFVVASSWCTIPSVGTSDDQSFAGVEC